ncbi:MAG: 23S rRNA (uridine(2552)-2'-O)-methyltransferase [Chromatiales bacterium 21-64-14]|nr:MAG: 23S rRNA (uridine(2552)-2'-O)-methyltransferase [Chromatiales bacterium 21-64-14]HQU15430.1 23S rRNA (uridine(2552)-2'-O)-methyltransferase RlmE [Gammaproteobacteria bacterium]
MARTKSSSRWLKEHHEDPYVRRAQREGFRSRAVYKLQEIQERDRILRPGMTLIDLGAAPGGWSQFAASRVAPAGRVVALDVLPMEPLPGVEVLQGDFRDPEPLGALRRCLAGGAVDLVMSDMAPNISGMRAVDQPRVVYLAELALLLAQEVLRPGGDLLVKLFQGEGFDSYLKELRARFDNVAVRKPKASRSRSAEVYLLARGFKI